MFLPWLRKKNPEFSLTTDKNSIQSKLSNQSKDYNFVIGDSAFAGHDINITIKTKKAVAKIAKCTKLEKTDISTEKIFQKTKYQGPDIKKSEIEISDLLAINKELILIKGTFYFSLGDDRGYKYPYFGIQDKKELLIEEFHELLRVLLIDGKYYFVTWWVRAESGGRGVIIYRFEKESLVEVFSDYSTAT